MIFVLFCFTATALSRTVVVSTLNKLTAKALIDSVPHNTELYTFLLGKPPYKQNGKLVDRLMDILIDY